MYFKEIAYKLKPNVTTDKFYRPVTTYTQEEFLCDVMSIGQNEFYQSATAGFKPEIKLKARVLDLDGIQHVKYNNKIYKILRTYQIEDYVELTLTSTVINNSVGISNG